jgi:hypothetical protein
MRVEITDHPRAVTRTAAVTDGPILDYPYNRTGRTFRLERITLRYTFEVEE